MPMSATISEMVYSQSKNPNNEASVSYLDVNSFLACISKGHLLLSAHYRSLMSVTIAVEYPVEGGISFLIGILTMRPEKLNATITEQTPFSTTIDSRLI
jgi:hypothetical protein